MISGLFRNASIKRKLMVSFMGISSIVVFLTGVTIVIYQVMVYRRYLVDDCLVQARMISENCLAALSFDDPEDAGKILLSLRAKPSIVYASVIRLDGTTFADYRRGGFARSPLAVPDVPFQFTGDWLLAVAPVVLNQKTIGHVFIQSDLREISAVLKQSTVVTSLIVCGVLLFALLISYRLQKFFSIPVLLLTKAAETISVDKDFSIRVKKKNDDEFGTLTDAFNNMLRQIQKNDLEMSQLRNFLKNIIDSMPSVLIGVDTGGRVTQWNRAAEMMTGISFEGSRGRPVDDVFPQLKEVMKQITGQIQQHKEVVHEKQVKTIDGVKRFLEVTTYPLIAEGNEGAVIRIDDVTSRVRIEEMMIQTEKMMSVGGLAAGMAHEINNPLSGILQSVQNMARRISDELPKNEQVAQECGTSVSVIQNYMEKRDIMKMLDMIRDAGLRASRIVKNMLQFSRKTEFQMSRVDIAELVDRTIELASSDFDLKKKYDFRNIQIEKDFHPEVPSVPCNASEIEQVLLNLLKNATQAMNMHNGGAEDNKITIRILRADDMVCIEVEDTGPGIPEHIRKRVFEPFFTTKDVGVGTGLGLSVSYFIITNNHKGKMYVESERERGSKFVIQLPLQAEDR